MLRQDYSKLMIRRINNILLICSNYDSFSLEEDGHIEARISQDYINLNLSNPPSIDRVESTVEALDFLKNSDKSYDLIITMFNVGNLDVFEFSRQAKELSPRTAIVLLSSFSKLIYEHILRQDTSKIDFIFSWNNNPNLIIAIIKLIEDKLNAEHDILKLGVRAIMLVENSIRYISAYLPQLYKLVLGQNKESVRDALNEDQQYIRKRSRPKILLATCYDEALELYRRYGKNMLGIISDVGFVIHKDDPRETEVIDAGINLCKLIKAENPTMPYLLQSSQESMRSVAEKLEVGFIRKTSKTLMHELSEYIAREFAFGDFIVTDPATGKEIARAKNLYEFEKVISTMSDEALRHFSDKNYISRWLYSRGLFSIGDSFRQISIKEDTDINDYRKLNLSLLHDYRIRQALGVVSKFDPETYNDTIWFSRLGRGSLGGKARGLAFLNHILSKYNLYGKWEGVRIMVPRTLVITTEYFDKFILENGLKYVINSDLSDEEILSEFVTSTLPADMTAALRVFIKNVRKPLAVRSSSLLEDSYYQPFAGVYSTYMIPYTGNVEQELRMLSKAIKSVYASVYFAASRGYVISTSNVISEEKMGIVLQEICGSEDQGYYFPTFSGLARSINYYPIGYETADDGVVKVAYGLGKAVVGGEQVLRFCPKYPKNTLQTSTPEHTMNETQRFMYALDLQPDKFRTSVDDAVNLERIPISECEQFHSLASVVSTWDYKNGRMLDTPLAQGTKYVTFAHILKYDTFPLADIVSTLLYIANKEVKSAVEIEFAVDFGKTSNSTSMFNVLQIRPISSSELAEQVNWDEIDTANAFLFSSCAIGPGRISGIKDIVYLKEENFDVLKTQEMAEQLKLLNDKMRNEERGFVLIGFGRWGSSIPSLGVPVKWSEISEAKMIVECSLENFQVDPSQGTHFFQNMTTLGAGYVNVNPYARKQECCKLEVLDALPAEWESEYIRLVHFEQELEIFSDGRANKAVININYIKELL